MDNVFKNNPELKVYYKTADGTAFYTEPDARMHARSLSDKSVEPVYRSVIENVAIVLEDDSQKKLQDAVQADALSGMMSEDEKEAEDKAKQEAEEKAKQEAEEKAKQEAEEKEKQEAEDKAKQEAEAQAQKDAEDKAKQEAEDKAKQEAEVKATKKAAAPKAKKVTQTKEK